MKSNFKNQLAVMSVQYVHYTLDYYIESMKKNSIKNIDLWGGLFHYCSLDYNEEEAKEKLLQIKHKLTDLDMKVVMYTPETLNYPYSISSCESKTIERTINYFKRAIDDALILGCDKVFINSGCAPRNLPREESWNRAVDSVKKICNYAQKKNVTIVMEQLQPYESNLVVTLEDMKRFFKEVNSDVLKVCIDVVAMAVSNETIEQYFEAFGTDKIYSIHFCDSNHYILGDGNLPLKEYLNTLEKYNFKGLIDLEINDSIYWENPHESVVKSLEYYNLFLM